MLYRSISCCNRYKPFTKCLFTSLTVCTRKGFDLWWNGWQTKGHQQCNLQTTPAQSPVMTAHHPQSPICVSDEAGFSLSICLCFLFCISITHSFTYWCTRTQAHSYTIIPHHCHPHHRRHWSYLKKRRKKVERLPCCQADVREGGNKGGRASERVVDE